MKNALILSLVLTIQFSLRAQVSTSDSLALVDFYHAMDGDNWDNKDNWLNGPVKDWQGIKVNDGKVYYIGFFNNGLKGALPASFNDLDSLIRLYLESDTILSPLPKMDQLDRLKIISLSNTPLNSTFPEQLRDLKSIEIINLGSCGLTGPLPSWLSELESLQYLEFASNKLEGDFFSVIKDMTQLKGITLFGNNFTGPLPNFSILPDLFRLSVGNNGFTGPFPMWVTNMDSLRDLHLGGCQLSGELPDNLFSQLNPKLEQFVLTKNDFTGDLEKIMDAPMTNLVRFEIGLNDFYGKFPEGIMLAENVYKFNIADNRISGLPDFSDIDHTVNWFYIRNNQLGFESLENCLTIMGPRPSRVTLGPQKPLLEEEHLYPATGDDIVLESGSGGQFSEYQWYKDSMPITNANESAFTISDYSSDDDGMYHCVITNSSFNFDLERNPVYVGTIVDVEDEDQASISIFPNPSNGRFYIQGIHDVDIAISDLSGQQVYFVSNYNGDNLDLLHLSPGHYLIQMSTTGYRVTRKVLVVR